MLSLASGAFFSFALNLSLLSSCCSFFCFQGLFPFFHRLVTSSCHFFCTALGSVSMLMSRRPADDDQSGFKNWTFTSVHLWGENPRGRWLLMIRDKARTLLILGLFPFLFSSTFS